ncbi:MAG: hypothetical protein ACI85I_001184, partial [Arenicella sp.]
MKKIQVLSKKMYGMKTPVGASHFVTFRRKSARSRHLASLAFERQIP